MTHAGDIPHLLRAIELAARGGRATAPNPRVGAVVVAAGEVVGEGWHRRAGEAHAETVALEMAGARARGATLYSSLEPCPHQGRTPPCTSRIIAAGIARVVLGLEDPDPRVRGRGATLLREAGVEVVAAQDAPARAAARAVEDYLVHRREGRAFAALKIAGTLDGKIADRARGSRWITGATAREHGRALRDRYGAIVVGAGTVRADDPLLLPPSFDPGAAPFLRCVISGSLELPAPARLLEPVEGSPVLVYTGAGAPAARSEGLRAAGIEVVVAGEAHEVEPLRVLRDLGARGVLGALVEGGGATHARFFDAGLVDKLYWYLAPRVLGDGGAVAAVDGPPRALAGAWAGAFAEARPLGEDLLLTVYPKGGIDPCSPDS
ncbi:MAG: bifunctional diaminohydroxyphosphoribosylaminopyrimidine deaminase/5-amino-6-(5-phosphoribosylamino)uracil reductase RibD [Acidobacteria bacterium]|nr:bifunctional diaminohydroxyphosphoribosylaminopyrimidine deaminase/5-amino-6-(5-phosphoribosylamino)uracil reductase RibD [Acidobacteriota bacterium]